MATADILFREVRVFDGKSAALIENVDVLIVNNIIDSIGPDIEVVTDTTVIDGSGRTLMPGLIDNHVHLMLQGSGVLDVEANQTWEDIAVNGVAIARMYLMEGFTTVRDMGGANAGLQRGIDAGKIIGPRLYPSAAFIGARGGHSDFAVYSSPPGAETQMSRLNMSAQVSGADEVLAAARNNFRMGATQLKIMQTGGVASHFDPWQLNGLTEAEISAAVQVASDYQSYVGAHSYSREAMLRALNLGVKTIEHGFMFDREIGKLMKKKGAYLVTNLTAFSPLLAEVPAVQNPKSAQKLKTAQASFGDYIENVRKYNPKRGFQTDCFGSVSACRKQAGYEKYLNGHFFGNHRALVALTSVGGEIAALSGPLVNPYPGTKLGVIEEGATADLLLVDGNPLEDLTVIGAHEKWFDAPERDGVATIRVIMKDGVIIKNSL
jgi:imidazolonepropionase-like amidohydrolase